MSLPMRSLSQSSVVMAYRLPTETAMPVILALITFSGETPVVKPSVVMVGPVRSMSAICAERANETLPTPSDARKQTYCPLYASSSSVTLSPD